MKQACEQIAKNNQATPGVEGYVFDGVEGSQMAFWTSGETATSEARSHEFDEYMLVMQGCYPLIVKRKSNSSEGGRRILYLEERHAQWRGSWGNEKRSMHLEAIAPIAE